MVPSQYGASLNLSQAISNYYGVSNGPRKPVPPPMTPNARSQPSRSIVNLINIRGELGVTWKRC